MLQKALVLLAALLPGCARPSAPSAEVSSQPAALSDQISAADVARAYVAKFRSDWGLSYPDAEEIRAWFALTTDDPQAPLSGLSELLKDDDPIIRAHAARYLGCLKDPMARNVLLNSLKDSDPNVRIAVCNALDWIGLDKASDQALVNIRRNDPSVEVRVMAARSLDRWSDDDAVAAFKLGLASKDENFRYECEGYLEKAGKLSLPLPDPIYTDIAYEEYERLLANGKVHRRATKNGKIYFEVTERVAVRPPPGAMCALGMEIHWYRTSKD